MPREARKYLWDIYDASSFLIEDHQNSTYAMFVQNRRQLASALHHLLVIGEACRVLRDVAPTIAAQFPKLNSADEMRNIIAHEYSDVDYALVWQTGSQELEPLRNSALKIYEETE
jgi:uncharacterized protein with HEPN domain